MHYLITGHTGFKGAWMSFLLARKGHEVSGYALDPIPGSLYADTTIKNGLSHDYRADIRDRDTLGRAFAEIKPDVVIHMAAQPLVLESYENPRETFESNVNGTLNILEATSNTPSVKAQVIITTDKVYKNKRQRAGYVETDELGGEDPYSASKAMADILTQAWIKSFPGVPTAIARAGNVIGGGDVSKNRLIPDLIKSYLEKKPALLRNPQAVRPWQHVLDCLAGYLKLTDYLLDGGTDTLWNFGPTSEEFMEVSTVADLVGKDWGVDPAWKHDSSTYPKEAHLLALDSSKARNVLNWKERFSFEVGVNITSNWYSSIQNGLTKEEATRRDIDAFLSRTV
jgi:CDP-glucose 4,6-dehydratase